MKEIKFSHCYKKLLDRHNDMVDSAILIHVEMVDIGDLSDQFKSYDTDNGVYKLPSSGTYLMLIFLKPHEDFITDLNLFTTLRRFTPQKFDYYKKSIGEKFKITLNEAKQ